MTVIIGLLILTIALWGVGDYFTQSNNDAVATVNGEKISLNEYNQQFASYRQNLMSQFGEGFDPSYFDSPMMKQNFLQSVINNELYKQAAVNNGYIVTESEIKQVIMEAPTFKDESDQFSPELYAAFLSQTNQSASVLEGKIADGLLATAVNDLVDTSTFTTPTEKKTISALNLQQRDFDYVLISPDLFLGDISITDEEIQLYYDENSDQYMTQEQVAVDYIELDAQKVASDINISEQDALKYFEDENNKQAYVKPEQRLASHILINVSNEAESKINDLKKQLDQGVDFATLAKEYSQDPGSADQGGDLGWVSPGDMVEAFDAALFSMQIGSISEPIETDFGWHLIQLNDIKESQLPLFEEVKEDIIQALQAQQAELLFLDKASELSALVLDAQDNLDQVAETVGLEKKTTELFTRSSGVGLASNEEFRAAAFSSLVKDELQNSDVINISDTHIVFIHINQVKEAILKPLEEVKVDIENVIKKEKAKEQAEAMAQDMLVELQESSQDMAILAENNELTVIEAIDVRRTGSEHPFQLVRNVFGTKKPKEGTIDYYVKPGNQSDVAVVALKAVKMANIDDADLTAEAAQLSRNIKNNEQQLLIQALREKAEIFINEDLLLQN